MYFDIWSIITLYCDEGDTITYIVENHIDEKKKQNTYLKSLRLILGKVSSEEIKKIIPYTKLVKFIINGYSDLLTESDLLYYNNYLITGRNLNFTPYQYDTVYYFLLM